MRCIEFSSFHSFHAGSGWCAVSRGGRGGRGARCRQRRLDNELSVVSDVRGDGLRVDGRRQVELVVELAAGGASSRPGLVTLGRHDQSLVDRLHRQLVYAELRTE